MNIPASQIEIKKKVGKSKGKDLTYVKLRGGLHMIVDDLGKTVGTGPHRCVARHIAEENDPDLEWTELSKGEHFPVDSFEHLLPKYREITTRLRALQEKK